MQTAKLHLPKKIEFGVVEGRIHFDLLAEVELEWKERDPLTVDAYASYGQVNEDTPKIYGSIRLYNAAGQEVGYIVDRGIPRSPNTVKKVGFGEMIYLPLYLDRAKLIERPGKYFGVAEFRGHARDKIVQFKTAKVEFEVVQSIDHPDRYPEAARRRWGLLQ